MYSIKITQCIIYIYIYILQKNSTTPHKSPTMPQKSLTFPQKSLMIAGYWEVPDAKELYHSAKESDTSTKEPYISAKEPCISAKEPHNSRLLRRSHFYGECSLSKSLNILYEMTHESRWLLRSSHLYGHYTPLTFTQCLRMCLFYKSIAHFQMGTDKWLYNWLFRISYL